MIAVDGRASGRGCLSPVQQTDQLARFDSHCGSSVIIDSGRSQRAHVGSCETFKLSKRRSGLQACMN